MTDLRAEVERYRAEHPDASWSQTARDVGRNKQAVLAVCRDLAAEDGVSVGSTLATRENRFLEPSEGAFGIEGAVWKSTSLDLPPNLAFEDYKKVGWALGRTRDMSAWGLGDWVLFGEAVFGEDKYAQAVEATGRSKQTLMNHASVSKRVPRSVRREGLSWSHHRAVAHLTPDEQEERLAAAEANRWSIEEFLGTLRPEPALPRGVDVVPEAQPDEKDLLLVRDVALAIIRQAERIGDGFVRIPEELLVRLADALVRTWSEDGP